MNALPATNETGDDRPYTPGLLRQLRSAYKVPIDGASQDGIGLLGAAVPRWTQQPQAASPETLDGLLAPEMRFHVIQISLRLRRRRTGIQFADGLHRRRIGPDSPVVKLQPQDPLTAPRTTAE